MSPIQNTADSRPGFEDFRSASPNFPTGFPSENMESRKYSAPQQTTSQSRHDSESIPIKVIHEPRNNDKHKYSTTQSKTTDIPTRTSGTSDLCESPRVTRAHSEPPKTFNQRPQQMKTKIPLGNLSEQMEHNLSTSASDPSVPVSNPGSSPGSSPGSGPGSNPGPGPGSNPGSNPESSRETPPSANVRHIPIFVEGRENPVMNKDSEMPKRPSDFVKKVDIKATSNKKEEPTSPLSPIPSDQPIPMGYTETDNSKVNGAENPQNLPPIPMPCSPDYLQSTNTDSSQTTTKVVDKPESKPDPCLQQLAKVQANVGELVKKLEKFQGSKDSKEYKYLDEMLTRNLLALDGLNVEGRDDVRQVRKESIKSINRCLSILESKASGASEQAAKNNDILSELASK